MGLKPIKPTTWSFEPKACKRNVPDCAFCREFNALLLQPDKIEAVFSEDSYYHVQDQLDGEYGHVERAPEDETRVIKHNLEWEHDHWQWMSRFEALYEHLQMGWPWEHLLGDEYEELISMSWLKLKGTDGVLKANALYIYRNLHRKAARARWRSLIKMLNGNFAAAVPQSMTYCSSIST